MNLGGYYSTHTTDSFLDPLGTHFPEKPSSVSDNPVITTLHFQSHTFSLFPGLYSSLDLIPC